jgi:hypothetical protein
MAYTRLERLQKRRLDPLMKVAGLNEVYNRLKEEPAIVYAVSAMQPIDPDYTKNTFEECGRVEEQLQAGFAADGIAVDFDHQGSVTNDTHIRAHSDIDLLSAEKKFFGVEPPNTPKYPYHGDPIADLRKIRSTTSKTLRAKFPKATVDESGSKSVKIEGGSLRRKIDVIACNWLQTVEYVQDPQKHWLGVEVLDNDNGRRIANKPFLHNKRIEERDVRTNGGLRKLIRLLKSLKYDSDDKIDLSSYDIAAITYNMPEDKMRFVTGGDLQLLQNCYDYLLNISLNSNLREAMEVPNGTRKVFCSEGATEAGLRQMTLAVGTLLEEIKLGLGRSMKKIAEARVSY